MHVNLELLQKLHAGVAAFYITDKTMKKAQERMAAALAAGQVDDAMAGAYANAVHRYFEGFEREAREHLRTVDKRLEHINQVHFNLSAERAVAVRRIEATQGVLAEISALDGLGVPAS